MSQLSVDLRHQPKKGPVLGPFKIAILDSLYALLERCRANSSHRRGYEHSIAFILRENCRCPDDSIYCMCGGGFDPRGINTAI